MDSAKDGTSPEAIDDREISTDESPKDELDEVGAQTLSPTMLQDLPRAASYPDFAIGDDFFLSPFTFSEDDLLPSPHNLRQYGLDQHHGHRYQRGGNLEHSRSNVYILDGEAEFAQNRISVSRTFPVAETKHNNQSHEEEDESIPTRSKSARRSRRLSRSLRDIGRKDKSLSRRSPSPSKQTATRNADQFPSVSTGPASKLINESREDKHERNGVVKEERSLKGLLNRKGSLFSRQPKETLNSSGKSSDASTPPPNRSPAKNFAAPLIKSMSAASLPTKAKTTTSNGNGVELPAKPPLVQSRSLQKKDQLWSAFRTLDNDFQRFQTKSTASKANFVRNNLLPFLKNHANHPSNKRLRPEDLERRVTILNKWWEAMLELLQPKSNQTLSGFDRPAILEGISGIMERPEWRAPPSPFSPAADLQSADAGQHKDPKSALDPETDDAEFFVQSIHHNVRNTFVHNLFVQITQVVDRMSSKNAPASLVKFSGKSCAYAFFFCPGVADILVRHWGVTSRDLRRVVGAFGADKSSNLRATASFVAPRFPETIQALGFKTTRALINYLKTKPILPMGLERVKWHGSWISRWSGRESDLFYIFVKHFHILAADFLPPDPSNTEKICAPGFALVYSQMLRNLDSTFNRASKSTVPEINNDLQSSSFDGILETDDAMTAIPAPPSNASRMMTENRFLLLLREFLSENKERHLLAKNMFAEGFWDLLKASTRATSLYNHEACFILLDFLQEALVVIGNFELSSMGDKFSLDWPFWLEVFRQMLKSDNMSTEMRLYTLIYTSWGFLTLNATDKEMLCMDFLLDTDIFYSRFNHWCPMVRAYFMRLLCWRVARFDGESSEVDVRIFKALVSRIQRVWSHYKYLAELAQLQGLLPPSTTPCNPAPGRKLYIIRTEVTVPHQKQSLTDDHQRGDQNGKDSSLDSTSESSSSLFGTAQWLERLSMNSDQNENVGKWKAGLLKTVMGSDKPKPSSQKSTDEEKKPTPASKAQGSSRYRWNPAESADRSSGFAQSTLTPRTTSMNTRNFEESPTEPQKKPIFKFVMEYVGKRPQGNPVNVVLTPPKLPLATQLLIQNRSGYRADVPASRPDSSLEGSVRYAGRALAEWTLIVNECQNFFERRRHEGVESNKDVESPMLSVDFMRKIN